MKNYKVKINWAEIEEWSNEEGPINFSNKWGKDVRIEKTIQVTEITRKDVLKAVTDMLYHYGEVNVDDLFDGNETYFIFSRLENEDSEELERGQDGYYVSYFIYVEAYEKVNAIDIK